MPDGIDRWDPIDYEKNSDFQYESAMAELEQLAIQSSQKIGCYYQAIDKSKEENRCF